MARKPLTTRTALITATAVATGSAVGTAADTVAAHLGYTGAGVSQAVTTIITVWMVDKLNTLIDHTK